jgi:hypothetical protein
MPEVIFINQGLVLWTYNLVLNLTERFYNLDHFHKK